MLGLLSGGGPGYQGGLAEARQPFAKLRDPVGVRVWRSEETEDGGSLRRRWWETGWRAEEEGWASPREGGVGDAGLRRASLPPQSKTIP